MVYCCTHARLKVSDEVSKQTGLHTFMSLDLSAAGQSRPREAVFPRGDWLGARGWLGSGVFGPLIGSEEWEAELRR